MLGWGVCQGVCVGGWGWCQDVCVLGVGGWGCQGVCVGGGGGGDRFMELTIALAIVSNQY